MMAVGIVTAAVMAVGALVAPKVAGTPWRVRPGGLVRVQPRGDARDLPGFLGRFAVWVDAAVRRGRSLRRRGQATCSSDAVAAWCDGLARAVRSGSTLRDATSAVLPDDEYTRHATDHLRLRLERGAALVSVMRDESAGAPDRHLHAARTVIGVAAELGGSSAAPLDRVAASLRSRAADDRERLAQAAQARLSSKVMTVVPLAMLTVLIVADPGVRAVVSTPPGAACVSAGLTVNAGGAWWMRRLIGGER